MKILKLKSILFCLLAVFTVTTFLTSCEKGTIASIEEEIIVEELTKEEQAKISSDIENVITSRNFNTNCFVKLCYSSYLQRCADANGFNYWLGVLGNASIHKIAAVAKGFITSQEAKNKWENNYASFIASNGLNRSDIKKSIYIAYRGLLLRQPDVGGGIHWTNVQKSHGLKEAIIGIASSPEFFNRLSNISAECNAYATSCP